MKEIFLTSFEIKKQGHDFIDEQAKILRTNLANKKKIASNTIEYV